MNVLSTLSEELCEGLVVAVDGEKDPRCLLLVFEIWCGGLTLPPALTMLPSPTLVTRGKSQQQRD
jgi:hypothetical protein